MPRISSYGSHLYVCWPNFTNMGHIWVLYGQKSLYGAHVGLEWDKCPDSAHMGPTYTCLLGWLYLLMTPALIMLVVPGLPSYNGAEVYYLKGVIGLPIVISFRDRWYTHIFFFFWKWAHWWRHRHRLDRFRFKNFQSPGLQQWLLK